MTRSELSLADILERDRQILLRIARAGDAGAAAVAELYDLYGRLVFSLIVKMVGNQAVAEELVQEVFVRVWRSAPTYQPELGSARAWLLAIAHHRAIDELRRWRKERDWISLDEVALEAPGTAEDAIGDPLVSRAMGALPTEQRLVIQLAYFHGLTGSEIAAKLNLPPGTVKSRLRLALEKLRAALGVGQDEAL